MRKKKSWTPVQIKWSAESWNGWKVLYLQWGVLVIHYEECSGTRGKKKCKNK